MSEQLAIYSQIAAELPEEFLQEVAQHVAPDATFSVLDPTGEEGEGPSYRFDWGDVEMTLNVMPRERLESHLSGFVGWVSDIYENRFDDRGRRLVDRIQATGLVVGVAIEPDRDDRVDRVLGAIIGTLQAIVFWGNVVLDTEARLLLAPDRSFEEEADVDGPLAGRQFWPTQLDNPTENQRARLARSKAELDARAAPQVESPLYTQDDEEIELREPAEVARRVLALWSVVLYGEGAPRDEALEAVHRYDLWDDLSPQERDFLENFDPSEDERRPFVWRLEAMWPLLWALGHIEELPWPAGFCDVPFLARLVRLHLDDPAFVDQAKLRPKREILDAADLTMRQHWAVRDAFLGEKPIPADLDWTGQAERMYVPGAPVTGVVAERHRALNWLIRFGDADWDQVDTPT